MMINRNNSDDDKKSGLYKMSLIMEKVWLALTIITLLAVIYIFIVDGVSRENIQYLVFPALTGLMYGFRTFFRKRMEKDKYNNN